MLCGCVFHGLNSISSQIKLLIHCVIPGMREMAGWNCSTVFHSVSHCSNSIPVPSSFSLVRDILAGTIRNISFLLRYLGHSCWLLQLFQTRLNFQSSGYIRTCPRRWFPSAPFGFISFRNWPEKYVPLSFFLVFKDCNVF